MSDILDEQQLPEEVRQSVEEAWPLFVDFLKKKDARVTQARKIVLTQVFSRHDHFCADDLAAQLSSGLNHVSRGTVYRTLALMEEAGLVRVIRDTDVHAHYEHTFNHPHHEHMICDKCGDFIEFSDEKIMELITEACKEKGFVERNHRIVVFGSCKSCADE
ncbi:Fur family transcriptional regulator [Pontiella sulfatireligans]|uniref:Ferric uptake regulation protein n=1 Tax=Pontiella sulfatireligans TaxID=2750658 RepID=A0A6C2UMM2_9BACT|nr:Fur family transcriptional regulator [Pontiella sulfatireligans]VGO21249.1 Ferric uptake regulation protein [Pontiella sulfatireligans]